MRQSLLPVGLTTSSRPPVSSCLVSLVDGFNARMRASFKGMALRPVCQLMASQQNAINLFGCHRSFLDAKGRKPAKRQQKTPLSRGFWIFRDYPEHETGAQKRTRTSTPFRVPAPEAGASTNSAIWATRSRVKAGTPAVNWHFEVFLSQRGRPPGKHGHPDSLPRKILRRSRAEAWRKRWTPCLGKAIIALNILDVSPFPEMAGCCLLRQG